MHAEWPLLKYHAFFSLSLYKLFFIFYTLLEPATLHPLKQFAVWLLLHAHSVKNGDGEVKGDITEHRDKDWTLCHLSDPMLMPPPHCQLGLSFNEASARTHTDTHTHFFLSTWSRGNTCGTVCASMRADVSHGDRLCVSRNGPYCFTSLSFIWSRGVCSFLLWAWSLQFISWLKKETLSRL